MWFLNDTNGRRFSQNLIQGNFTGFDDKLLCFVSFESRQKWQDDFGDTYIPFSGDSPYRSQVTCQKFVVLKKIKPSFATCFGLQYNIVQYVVTREYSLPLYKIFYLRTNDLRLNDKFNIWHVITMKNTVETQLIITWWSDIISKRHQATCFDLHGVHFYIFYNVCIGLRMA
jgi:hypothetical protein